jgi:hypothetical protein
MCKCKYTKTEILVIDMSLSRGIFQRKKYNFLSEISLFGNKISISAGY